MPSSPTFSCPSRRRRDSSHSTTQKKPPCWPRGCGAPVAETGSGLGRPEAVLVDRSSPRRAVRGARRRNEARGKVAPGPRPRGVRGDEEVGETVSEGFVVHPPATKLRPSLFGCSFYREPDVLQLFDRLGELVVGELDRCLRQRVFVKGPPERP